MSAFGLITGGLLLLLVDIEGALEMTGTMVGGRVILNRCSCRWRRDKPSTGEVRDVEHCRRDH